jgi:hypothetical protein
MESVDALPSVASWWLAVSFAMGVDLIRISHDESSEVAVKRQPCRSLFLMATPPTQVI